jgi:hypothetical protein
LRRSGRRISNVDLIGKVMVIRMQDEAIRGMFEVSGPPPDVDSKRWLVRGMVAGELPGIGVWIHVAEVRSPTGRDVAAPEGAETISILFPWSSMAAAFVFDAGLEEKTIGFQLNIPNEG